MVRDKLFKKNGVKKVRSLVAFVDEIARHFLDLSSLLDTNDLDRDVGRVRYDGRRNLDDVRLHHIGASVYLQNVGSSKQVACTCTSGT